MKRTKNEVINTLYSLSLPTDKTLNFQKKALNHE